MNSLSPTAPSSSPQNVFAYVISSTEIIVQWNEVAEIDQNGIITEYEIMYEPFTTFGGLIPASDSDTISSLNMSVSISNLQEYVWYNFSMSASTAEGFGPYSERISVLTAEDGKDYIHCLYFEGLV